MKYLDKKSYDECIQRISDCSKLEKDWNGYGADPIPEQVIENAFTVLNKLEIKPEIFPTANHSIQFEWEINNEESAKYFEIEISETEMTLFLAQKEKGTYNEENSLGFSIPVEKLSLFTKMTSMINILFVKKYFGVNFLVSDIRDIVK